LKFTATLGRRNALGAIFVVALILLGAIPTLALLFEPDGPEYLTIPWDEERVDADAVMLTRHGHRVAGSNNEYLASKYLVSELESAGLVNVKHEQFTMDSYEVLGASLSIHEEPMDDHRDFLHYIDYVAYPFCSSGGATALPVFVGEGTAAEFDKVDVAGKIVLGNTGKIGRHGLAVEAAKRGAAGAISINDQVNPDGGYPPYSMDSEVLTDSWDEYYRMWVQEDKGIPALTVSKGVGDDLLEFMDKYPSVLTYDRVSLSMSSRCAIEPRPVNVVTADVRGVDDPDEFVLIGGHLDTVYAGPGAVDNTAGVLTLLEMARQWAGLEPTRTIRFAFWGGEEIGIRGSEEWYNEHRAEVDEHMMFYMNWDMNNVDLRYGNTTGMAISSPEHYEEMLDIHDWLQSEYPEYNKYSSGFGLTGEGRLGGTDWAYFYNGGGQHSLGGGHEVLQAGGSGSWGRTYHTHFDTIDQLNSHSMGYFAQMYGALAWLHIG